MPAKSKAQQRFMGMVHKCQKDGECESPEIKKTAKSMKKKDADDFASTKHKGLPEKKKKKKFVSESLELYLNENIMDQDFGGLEDESILDELQELGLTYEEADFAIGSIDPDQLEIYKSEIRDGNRDSEEVALEIYNSLFGEAL